MSNNTNDGVNNNVNNNATYNFINKPNDRYVTPDSLAWNLVMGDDVDNFGGVMETFVTDLSGSSRADRLMQIADEFQVLVSIYMEMIFNVLKTNFMGELLDPDGEVRNDIDLELELANYIPDFSQYTIEDMTTMFRDKFAKIRYFLSVQDISEFCDFDDFNDYGLDSEYYCKTLLLDDGQISSRRYFEKATHIPDGKRYTFLMRDDKEPQQERLDDFYTVMYIPSFAGSNSMITKMNRKGRKIKVSFSKYNIMSDK